MAGTIFAWGIAYLGLGLGWYAFVGYQLYRTTSMSRYSAFQTWPAQWTVIAVLSVFIVCVADDDPFWVLAVGATVVFPPLAGFLLLSPVIASFVLPLAVVVMITLAIGPATRKFAPLLGFAITLAITPFTVDWYWDRAMCSSAHDLGLSDIQRPDFLYSLSRVGGKSGREPYAYALNGAEIWDWSYSRERFVKYRGAIPEWVDLSEFKSLECSEGA